MGVGMKGIRGCLCLVVGLAQGVAAQSRRVGFSEAGWIMSGAGTGAQEVDGRDALVVGNGSAARLDIPVEDGTFEFDVRMPAVRSFVGFRFRMDAVGNAEEFYFRPHKSGQPDALQYAPVFGGESYWQVFHGPSSTAAVAFPSESEWLHVRLVVAGRRAAVYLGGGSTPVLVSDLARDPGPGFFALYASHSSVPGAPPAVAAVSNFVVTPGHAGDSLPAATPAPSFPAGGVREWELSDVFAWPGGLPIAVPAAVGAEGSWLGATSDDTGILLVGRFRARPPAAGSAGVLARFRVRSSRAQVKRLDIGFSDAAALFLNGEVVYAADHGFSQNFPRRQGLVTPSQAALFLPLREGENEIVLAVVDAMGGWAVAAAFEDRAGLTILRPGR
jgi:hypothetical protein